jgi:hypothetical protein
MAISKINKKRDILAELFTSRDKNIEVATKWNVWEIEEQIKSVESARESFLEQNPNHDLRVINEHHDQLTQALKIKLQDQQHEL